MGVHGLWRLIEPSGKSVPLETLENKILAVDISIWLHQAVKGFQDSRGAQIPNAHLLGLYHRLCKLLYFRIRPIFVFDGGVPVLKKQTMAKRNQEKSKTLMEANSIQSKLLSTILKHSAVKNALSEKVEVNELKDPDASKNDIFKLPELESKLEDSMESSGSSDESSSIGNWDLHTIDEKSEHFKSLPADVRHDILTEIIETRKQSSWGRINEMPKESKQFSNFQMNRLLKRYSVQISLEEAQKEMGGNSLSLKELEAILSAEGIVTASESSAKNRIASNSCSRYLLIKDVKKAMNAEKEEERKKTYAEVSEAPETGTSTNDKELEQNLATAIQLSLQEQPSTSKDSFSYLENFNDADFASSSESENECMEPVLAQAKGYMLEYAGLTPAEVSKIINRHTTKTRNTKALSNKQQETVSTSENDNLQKVISSDENTRPETQNTTVSSSQHVSTKGKYNLREKYFVLEKSDSQVTENKTTKENVILCTNDNSETISECIKENETTSMTGIKHIKNCVPKNDSFSDTSFSEIKNKKISQLVTTAPNSEKDDCSKIASGVENTQSEFKDNTITNLELVSPCKQRSTVTKKSDSQIVTDRKTEENITSLSNIENTIHNGTEDSNKIYVEKIKTIKNITSLLLQNNSVDSNGLTDITEKITNTENENILKQVKKKMDISNANTSSVQNINSITKINSFSKIDTSKSNYGDKVKYTDKNPMVSDSDDSDYSDFIEVASPNAEKEKSTKDENLRIKENLFQNDLLKKMIGAAAIERLSASENVRTEYRKENDNDKSESTTRKTVEIAEVEQTTLDISKQALTVEELISMDLELTKNQQRLVNEKNVKERIAASISDQMYQEAQELLELFGVPYITAPMEAEAQCAFLNEINLTDGTITDDSDIWLFGGKTVYKNFFNQKKHVLEFRAENIEYHFKLSREQLILLALLVGSDYTLGIQGIGPVTALEILASFPATKSTPVITQDELLVGLKNFKRWLLNGKVTGAGRTSLRSKLRNINIGEGFPSLQVVQAYLQPKVDTCSDRFTWGKINVPALIDFAREKFGWSKLKSEEILKPIVKKLEQSCIQKSIKDYFTTKHKLLSNDVVDSKLSKRVKMAVKKIENKDEQSVIDTESKKSTNNRKRKSEQDTKKKPIAAPRNKRSVRKLDTNMELIPQKERDKVDALKNKLKAIEVFRKSKKGPGYVRKRLKAATEHKETNLSESSSSDD